MLGRVSILALFLGALLGAAVGLHLLPATSVATLGLGVLGVSVVVAAVMASTKAARGAGVLAGVFLLGALSGHLHHRLYNTRQSQLPPRTVMATLEGRLVDEQPVDRGKRFVVDVDSVIDAPDVAAAHDGAPLPFGTKAHRVSAHLQLAVFAPTDARVGDRVRFRGRVTRPPPAFSPGTFAADLLARSRGLHGLVRVYDSGDLDIVDGGAPPTLVMARARLRERLQAQVTPRLAGLLLALLIGDVSLFDDEQNTAYRHVGAGHLLAVSGLQVTLLAVVLQRFAGVIVLLLGGRRRRWLTLAGGVALLGVWGFVGLCGMPPSAVRAALMASAVVVGRLSGRRVMLVDAIALAGLLTVLASPVAVDDAGFLLSYVAVLALVATSVDVDVESPDDDDAPAQRTAWWSRLRHEVWPRFRGPIIASVTAGLATAPLSAWLFGQFAPAGLVANIVLVPVASAAQLPALLCGVVGAVTNVAFITWVGGEAALVLESLVFGLAEVLPGVAAVEPPSATVAVILVALALFGGGALMAKRTPVAVAVAALALVLLFVSGRPPDGLRVTFLPVGQGDGVVVEMPNGTVMVVDAGGRVAMDASASEQQRLEALTDPGRRVVLPFLQRRGIEAIDIMVASHPHPDHVGGLQALTAAMPVGELWMAGDVENPGFLMAPLITAVGVQQVRSTPALLGSHHYGDVEVQVLGPAPVEKTPTYPELHANDNSLVVRLCYRGHCVLLPGDVEAFGEDALVETVANELTADVVKAGHHGSRTSSTPAFVAATKARHVVLCTGLDNTFHFPSAEVVTRWEAAGARIWDTAIHGELRFVIDDDGVRVSPYREGEKR